MYNNQPRIYALKDLPPEVVAVTFAKCSRSAEPFDQIAKELTAEKSADFNEKWVVNYGHGSVAEHAFFNIAIENVSLIAVEAIQANRLGSYTEKSSRYQIYNEDRIFIPKIFYANPSLKNLYLESIFNLFSVYQKSIDPIQNAIYKIYPNTNNEPEEIWKAKIKSKWIDICRFLLPNCVLANLGASMNARSWEYAITKMLSHPLHEVREIGEKVKEVALSITPTLVKYANPNQYYVDNDNHLLSTADDLAINLKSPEFSGDNKLEVDLIDYDKDGEDKILAAMIYKYQSISYREAINQVKAMKPSEKEAIFEKILKNAKNIYDKPPRELEYSYYTFDCLLDQGAYYDLKRNRIMTQTPQILHGQYGYYTPKIFDEVGLGSEYRQAMEKAHDTALLISNDYPYEAQYITTKATARRYIMKMNLREAFYFVGLRSKKNGHIMYRKIAQMVFDQIYKVHPNIAKYIMVDKG
jgi:thymidylate synthase ThyX